MPNEYGPQDVGGPFTGILNQAATQPQPRQQFSGTEHAGGAILGIGARFLEGLAKGKALKAYRQENDRVKSFQALGRLSDQIDKLDLPADEKAKRQAGLQKIILTHFGSAIDEPKKGKGDQQQGIIGHVGGFLRNAAESLTGGPLPRKYEGPKSEDLISLLDVAPEQSLSGQVSKKEESIQQKLKGLPPDATLDDVSKQIGPEMSWMAQNAPDRHKSWDKTLQQSFQQKPPLGSPESSAYEIEHPIPTAKPRTGEAPPPSMAGYNPIAGAPTASSGEKPPPTAGTMDVGKMAHAYGGKLISGHDKNTGAEMSVVEIPKGPRIGYFTRDGKDVTGAFVPGAGGNVKTGRPLTGKDLPPDMKTDSAGNPVDPSRTYVPLMEGTRIIGAQPITASPSSAGKYTFKTFAGPDGKPQIEAIDKQSLQRTVIGQAPAGAEYKIFTDPASGEQTLITVPKYTSPSGGRGKTATEKPVPTKATGETPTPTSVPRREEKKPPVSATPNEKTPPGISLGHKPVKMAPADAKAMENIQTARTSAQKVKAALEQVGPDGKPLYEHNSWTDVASARFKYFQYSHGKSPEGYYADYIPLAARMKIIAGLPYLQGTRSIKYLQQIQEHIPDPAHDSPQNAYKKVTALLSGLNDIEPIVKAGGKEVPASASKIPKNPYED